MRSPFSALKPHLATRCGRALAVGAALLVTGCTGGTPWGATPQNLPQVTLPRLEHIPAHVDAGTNAGAQRLAERVRAALAAQPALSAVQVEGYEGGLIILSGTAPSPAGRAQAVQLARQVVGVREVVDRLAGR
ncbi:BON domain-containing protein [Ottowia testudinis]|uniref:BON domain-containing protein n=1 Tax=Ottowia testudinis TaxID=2816950 RepID=A0A975CFE0_9BURK|nr:BON domain-containing protein [Ottowia testudinis]QTD44766.1 BON domain-containing protein [Ottowia testudinis]